MTVQSRSLDGESKLSIQHIMAIGPTRPVRGVLECSIILLGGTEVRLMMSHEDLVDAINESAGRVEVGTAEGLAKISVGIARNTETLVSALQRFGSGSA